MNKAALSYCNAANVLMRYFMCRTTDTGKCTNSKAMQMSMIDCQIGEGAPTHYVVNILSEDCEHDK